MQRRYTDVAGCVRMVTVDHVDGVRVERDVLTEQGRKEWARRVEALRKREASNRLGPRMGVRRIGDDGASSLVFSDNNEDL